MDNILYIKKKNLKYGCFTFFKTRHDKATTKAVKTVEIVL